MGTSHVNLLNQVFPSKLHFMLPIGSEWSESNLQGLDERNQQADHYTIKNELKRE